MSRVYEAHMEEIDRGWHSTGASICEFGVNQPWIAEQIRKASDESLKCDACGHSPASSLDLVVEIVKEVLDFFYSDAESELLPWSSRDGGYQWPTADPWDVIADEVDFFSDKDNHFDLIESVQQSFVDKIWVNRDTLHTASETAIATAWATFCEEIKYRSRFVFWLRPSTPSDPYDPMSISPAKVLDHLARAMRNLEMILTVPSGTSFYRVVEVDESDEVSASRLGTLPRKLSATTHNRMSPPGIPLFYGAGDESTARAEVLDDLNNDSRLFKIGTFSNARPLRILDLTKIPKVNSIFDEKHGPALPLIRWLECFVAEITKPISNNESPLEYVPTQVLTEFFLRIYGQTPNVAPDGEDSLHFPDSFDDAYEAVIGIAYPSAKSMGGVCYAIDIPNERCFDPDQVPTDGNACLVLSEVKDMNQSDLV